MEDRVQLRRVDGTESLARAKVAEVVVGADLAGRQDTFNPAALLLAALVVGMSKGRNTPWGSSFKIVCNQYIRLGNLMVC